jgi:beta-galactosidase/beta-glucuronidase
MQMKLETCIPRPEYPRPQMVRKEWINLNGEWEFEVDYGNSGKERKWFEKKFLNQKIIVPFCPESKLSEIENKDFMNAVWYRREFEIPYTWYTEKTILHFGAVDYLTEVWINDISVGKHRGGYSSFSFDISDLLKTGENTIFVCAQDDVRTGKQPRGKQSSSYFSQGCDYTRTT